MNTYQVIVSRVGEVYNGTDYNEALRIYDLYVAYSNGELPDSNRNKDAYGENVELFDNTKVLKSHIGWFDAEADTYWDKEDEY